MIISLRPMTYEDLAFVNEVRNSVAEEYLHDPREFTLEETQAWFLENKPEWYMIIGEDLILSLNTNLDITGTYTAPMGYFRTKRLDNGILEVGADLHWEFRGLGLGYKAWHIFLDMIFKTEEEVTLQVLGDNTIAYNLYRKLGFTVICTGGTEVTRHGRLYPSIEMWLGKDER